MRNALPFWVVVALSPLLAATSHAAPEVTTYSADNDIPPRLQWNANYGYCGEVSFISAGLYYGQYMSQYEARALASPGVPQDKAKSQLLLGVNDTSAAAAMHLTATEWNPTGSDGVDDFLAWVKQNVISGYPVAIGIYTNEYLFYGKTNATAGDAQYDHIVPVTGVSSTDPLALPAVYYGTDEITFSDNGLWTGTTGSPTYTFTYDFASFEATRAEANAHDGAIYSLAKVARNYGVAITGVIDDDHETLPVRVATNLNYEKPAIKHGSNTAPTPEALTLTVTVSGLKPGVAYNLYRYDAMTDVPNSGFNANAASAAQQWSIQITSGSTWQLTQSIKSDDVVAYRAVAASAP